MTQIRSLCVLCGSREGTDPVYRDAAVRLGRLIAEQDVRLIYGGGSIGLMGIIANAVLSAFSDPLRSGTPRSDRPGDYRQHA